jgi:prolyl oligopeptidase PreP (S9A serine peptidase family)
MVTAGIYGFADMAVDVKNGKMIQYDRGDEEEEEIIAEESVGINAATTVKNQLLAKQQEELAGRVDVQRKKEQAEKNIKAIQKKKLKEEPVVENPVITEEVVVAELTTDVKVDSVPEIILEEDKFDYREFSRGAPRKHKKNKKDKD